MESASLLTSTVEEKQRKGNKSKERGSKGKNEERASSTLRCSWEHHLYIIGRNDFHVFPTISLQCHGWGMTEGLSVKSHRIEGHLNKSKFQKINKHLRMDIFNIENRLLKGVSGTQKLFMIIMMIVLEL